MPSTAYIVTRGIVLRETETKEADKILTVLTPDFGKIAVIARGVRRKTCRFAAAAQSLAYSELTLYQKGNWYYLNEGSTMELFAELRQDLERLSLGFYFAELTETIAGEESAPAVLSHLLNGLYALGKLKYPPELVKAAFELKLLCLAGYEPLADGCAVCGNPEPLEPLLDVRQGLLRCGGCGGRGNAFPLCGESLKALRYIVYGDPKRLYSFALSGEALSRLSVASEAFVTAQLERNFRTLDFYRSLQGDKAVQ